MCKITMVDRFLTWLTEIRSNMGQSDLNLMAASGSGRLAAIAAAQSTGGEAAAAAHRRTWPKRPSGALFERGLHG